MRYSNINMIKKKVAIILATIVVSGVIFTSKIYARQVADPLDTHAKVIIGVGTETWNQNSNINGIQKMNSTNLSGYFEEDAEGLYIASHITIFAGSLGAITFSDGTSTANTFMANTNMDLQGVCYTTKGIAVMVGPYIGVTAVGLGGASTSSALLGSSFSGNAESIVLSSMGVSARIHGYIGDHVDLSLQGFYGFWSPYSNTTIVSSHVNAGLLGGTQNTTSMSYYFENISDTGVGLQVGIRLMRQVGIVVGGRYEDIISSGKDNKDIEITNLNSLIALGLWF